MALSASTDDRTDQIRRLLKGSNLKGHLYLEAMNSSGSWQIIDDLDTERGVDFETSGKKFKYGTTTFVPTTAPISFQVISKDGKYAPGSGDADAGLFDLDTKIRLTAGYRLDDATGETTKTASLTSTTLGYRYYTKTNGSFIDLDDTNSEGTTTNFFTDLFHTFYDDILYDAGTYSADAFFVYDFDLLGDDIEEVKELNVTCNNTSGTIYYRSINNLIEAKEVENQSTFWTNAGATVNGTKTITVPNLNDRHFLVAVVYDGISWSDDLRITDINIKADSFMEWIYRDVYYLDSPTFTEPSAPGIPMVICKGRDIWKRANDTDINLADISVAGTGGAGQQLDDLIRDIADQIGVQYTVSSIADLSAYPARTLSTGLGGPEKAINVFEKIIQILNQKSSPTGFKYWLYLKYDATIDDKILYVQPKPTAVEATFVLNYQHYSSIGAKRKNYDKAIKLMTVITNDPGVGVEELLDSKVTQTGTGDQAFSWSGNAAYRRIEFTTSDSGYSITATSLNPTSATITVTAGTGTGTWSLLLYGQKWTGADPTFEGEAISPTNSSIGSSNKFINQLLVSDAECKAVADGVIDDLSTPVNEANSVRYPYLNLLPEVNDVHLLWSRFVFVDDIYNLTGIKHHWDMSSNPSDSTMFNLDDTGLNFSSVAVNGFIYDDVIDYGKGFVYDMKYGVGGTIDTSVYGVSSHPIDLGPI